MNDSSIHVNTIIRSLDGLALRHKVAASNLANASTPGFKRREVSFEDQLEQAARGGRFEPEVTVDRSPGDADGNNVVSEDEVGALTRVELTYQALTRAMAHRANLMRLAVSSNR
jgi:flagellar basal-body rod protein FlgB